MIDITGRGVSDTCSKTIRIPVPAEDRDKWMSSEKLYRFWKLRVKGYTAADTDTISYIVEEAKDSIVNKPENLTNFYCKTVLDGKWTNSQCGIESEKCSGAMKKRKNMTLCLKWIWGNSGATQQRK